jgi:hypothetical protein
VKGKKWFWAFQSLRIRRSLDNLVSGLRCLLVYARMSINHLQRRAGKAFGSCFARQEKALV